MEYGASAEDVARVCHAHPVCHMKFIDTSCDAVVCLRQTQKPSGSLPHGLLWKCRQLLDTIVLVVPVIILSMLVLK